MYSRSSAAKLNGVSVRGRCARGDDARQLQRRVGFVVPNGASAKQLGRVQVDAQLAVLFIPVVFVVVFVVAVVCHRKPIVLWPASGGTPGRTRAHLIRALFVVKVGVGLGRARRTVLRWRLHCAALVALVVLLHTT